MRVEFDDASRPGVAPKDMALAHIGRFGAAGGDACAIEFAGAAVRALSVEGRLTLCNMAVEFGAWTGIEAPRRRDDRLDRGRPFAPEGAMLDRAAAHGSASPPTTARAGTRAASSTARRSPRR